jgi:catalase
MDRDEALIELPLPIDGTATYWDHRVADDHYEQPGILFRKMSSEQQRLLFENTARAIGDARIEVKLRHIANCAKADPTYGASGGGHRFHAAGNRRGVTPLRPARPTNGPPPDAGRAG